MRDGFQLGLTGADEACEHISFSGRRDNWNIRAYKSQDEIDCAGRFCRAERPELTELKKMPENSPVDVRAESADKKSRCDFQVTSVWPEEFLRELGRNDKIDRTISRKQLMDFVRAAIQKKLDKKPSSHDVDLLIDTKPADLPAQCSQKIERAVLFRQEIGALGNFQQIWIVGLDNAARLK